MTPRTPSFVGLSSEDLLAEIPRLASTERHATAAPVAALAVMDERRLYVREGYPSLFAYCTGRLHLSEPSACRRIEAARAIRRYPLILERLEEGALTLVAVGLLAKHLTPENHVAVLDAARHRGKRDLEALVARLAPQADVPSAVRKLPEPRGLRADATANSQGLPSRACVPPPSALPTAMPGGARAFSGATGSAASLLQGTVAADTAPPPAIPDRTPAPRPAIVRPLAPTRYQVTVTVSAETHAKLLRARDLLRHAIPSGDPALVLDRALTVLLAQLEKTKFAATAPVPAGRQAATTARSPARPSAPRQKHGAAADGAMDDRHSSGGANGVDPPRSRYIPAAVRREVWARSEGRCEFVSESGYRCGATGFLEFHHRVPFAAGGVSSATNVAVHCKAHNGHEAEMFFGAALIEARRSAVAPRDAAGRNGTGEVGSPSPATVARR